ncbi:MULTISPECIES: GreA/GreB family elongation factor [unclassified Streptomyces]|uniref:GreA/GreB family elongation factor n=1 Tax=unclassified Streptomyces TaxID=2593676 RepID=UPI0022B70309|nr:MULTISPECIES: GreA/GreB family elongation factor [unclassified Streptomyces]MCZ7416059.1 GreA/GreB family elongation factor [Streptomyces sp. WMMC897]MCZ7434134.1 GreA/GreB family elongation factor [Streptomyces sp. WMMC1477]
MTGGPEPMSADALRAFRRELDDLRDERAKVAATLRGEDPAGDRADEADQLRRASDIVRLDRRIFELEGRIRQASVADPPPADVVAVGSSVTLRFGDGAEETLQVGDVAEALDPAEVTVDSPLGRALLGRRAGDAVRYTTPAGPATAVVLSIGGGPAHG